MNFADKGSVVKLGRHWHRELYPKNLATANIRRWHNQAMTALTKQLPAVNQSLSGIKTTDKWKQYRIAIPETFVGTVIGCRGENLFLMNEVVAGTADALKHLHRVTFDKVCNHATGFRECVIKAAKPHVLVKAVHVLANYLRKLLIVPSKHGGEQKVVPNGHCFMCILVAIDEYERLRSTFIADCKSKFGVNVGISMEPGLSVYIDFTCDTVLPITLAMAYTMGQVWGQ